MAPSTFADAIRAREFAQAWELFKRMPKSELRTPEVRYVRARVAVELGDFESALRLVEDLDKEFPEFAQEASSVRLRAARISRDVTLLAHFLAGSKDPADVLELAEAHAAGSSWIEARRLAGQALGQLKNAKRRDVLTQQARAHVIIATSLVAEDKKREAAREYRWLATHAAALDATAKYDESMLKLDPNSALTSEERLSRAKTFSEAGWVAQTEDELSKLKAAEQPDAGEEALLAWAIYISRTDYIQASELFAKAARRGGEERQKHLYYEAKALARSHRDADAIAKYDVVAAIPGMYADHAAFQSARLRFIDGQWEAAISSYQKYLRRFGGSAKHRGEASYDLPVARLAAGQFPAALGELRALLKRESDSRQRARLMELEGVALLGSGKREAAVRAFEAVIEYRPLSLPALLAAARLRQMGEKAPPPALPPPNEYQKSSPPLALSLPDKASRLQRVGLDEEAESALRTHESAVRLQVGERSGEALCELYGRLESAQRRYQIAQTATTWNVLKYAPTSHTSWQWDCIYPEPYADVVHRAATTYRVPAALVYAVMRQESSFRPAVVSPADAVGLMQIIPPTATRIAVELNARLTPELMRAPAVNIRFGTYYLRRLLDMFGNRLELAAAAYNAGPKALTRWLRKGEDLPLDIFVARIPYSETRNYVYRVLGNYARYSYRDREGRLDPIELDLPKGLRADDDAY